MAQFNEYHLSQGEESGWLTNKMTRQQIAATSLQAGY